MNLFHKIARCLSLCLVLSLPVFHLPLVNGEVVGLVNSNFELLTPTMIASSFPPGFKYLLNSQKQEGNFIYSYNIETKGQVNGDSDVRQAGALWGLACLHRAMGDPETRQAVERGITFFLKNTRSTSEGYRYVTYPASRTGNTGTVALLSLAFIELMDSSPALKDRYFPEFETYIKFLLTLQKPNGQFYASYDLNTGKPNTENSSPYFDGETLLALIRAHKEIGVSGLKTVILSAAEAMYRENVQKALHIDRHSRTTKGFYQWGSMAYYEIFTSGWSEVEKLYASRVIRMAAWMVKSEHILRAVTNTAYAYEGLLSAWEVANRTGDQAALVPLTRVIDQGLSKLIRLQIGGPLPNHLSGTSVEKDPLAMGGVLRSEDDPVLRIDFTQHQMHALLLAQRYIFTKRS